MKIEKRKDSDIRFELSHVISPDEYYRQATAAAHQLRLAAGVGLKEAQKVFAHAIEQAAEIERTAKLTTDAMRTLNGSIGRLWEYLEGVKNVASQNAIEGYGNSGMDSGTAPENGDVRHLLGNVVEGDPPAGPAIGEGQD